MTISVNIIGNVRTDKGINLVMIVMYRKTQDDKQLIYVTRDTAIVEEEGLQF